MVNNYTTLYLITEEKKRFITIRILYGRRVWINIIYTMLPTGKIIPVFLCTMI